MEAEVAEMEEELFRDKLEQMVAVIERVVAIV